MIHTKRIHSQLSLSCEKLIASVDPGGREGGGRLTIDTERIISQLSLSHRKTITSVDPGRGADQ